jgi:hypothetical protein
MTERARTVDVGAQSLLVREWGEPGAPVALFVHGAGDDGTQASPLAAALEDATSTYAASLITPAWSAGSRTHRNKRVGDP